jgi:HSP20 family protein
MIEKTLPGGLWPQIFSPFQHMGAKLQEWLAPASEASSDDDAYEVSMELPGVREEDIDIRVANDVLTVRGEKRNEREEKGDTWFFSERQYGSFSRSFRLPPDADPSAISADLKDGVLNLRIGRRRLEDNSGARKIAITKG